MFEPKLNYLYFDPSEIISMSDDNIVSKKQHWQTLESYIKKYCHDKKYNNPKELKKLITNIKHLFNDMKFYEIFNEDNVNPLKDYSLKCSGKSFEFILVINSFTSMIFMHITYFYGISDQVEISISRTINNGEDSEIDFSNHILSPRGIYYAILSNDFQMDPYRTCSILSSFNDISENAAKHINNSGYDSNNIIADALLKRFAAFKYFCMKPEMREKYLLKDDTIDYKSIIDSDNINDEYYTIENIMTLTEECNPNVDILSTFTTLTPMMIDISDLNYIIAEISIDTILIDALDTKIYIYKFGGKQSVDNDIITKLNELSYKYCAYYNSLLEKILRLNINNNPLEQFNEYINPPEYLQIDKDKMLTSDEDAFDTNSNQNNANKEGMEDYQRYLQQKDIYNQVHQYLKKHVKDYDLIFTNKNLQTIFCRADVNMTCFANIDPIIKISSIKNQHRNYSLLEDQVSESASLLNFYTRADYDIEPTLDNLYRIYKDYVHPIIYAVNNMSSNINSIQESLSMINFDKYFSNINQDPNEDDDD